MGDARPERRLGCYKLLHLLARGGMSEVYLASNESSTQTYALKMVHQIDEEYYLRFQHEIRLQSSLKHPHILPILDYGEQDGICYCVMPYIQHGTLKDRIAQRPLNLYEAEYILAQVADALQFLHEAGIVHRDIKPANILLDETNYVWLADFGLVKEIDGISGLTGIGCLIGTPFYLAPELLEKPASASSDLYALGVVLYEMLTGKIPFNGKTPLLICIKHLHELPPPPSKLNTLLSPAIEQVVLQALKKHPAARFPTARSLAAAYSQALTQPFTAEETQPDNRTFLFIKLTSISALWTKIQGQPRVHLVILAVIIMMSIFTLCLASPGGYPGNAPAPTHKAQVILLPTRVTSNMPAQPNPPDKAEMNGIPQPQPENMQKDKTGKHHKPKGGSQGHGQQGSDE